MDGFALFPPTRLGSSEGMRAVLGVEGGALWDSELVPAAAGAGDVAPTDHHKNTAGARGLGRRL